MSLTIGEVQVGVATGVPDQVNIVSFTWKNDPKLSRDKVVAQGTLLVALSPGT